jgi:hypothetical protein
MKQFYRIESPVIVSQLIVFAAAGFRGVVKSQTNLLIGQARSRFPTICVLVLLFTLRQLDIDDDMPPKKAAVNSISADTLPSTTLIPNSPSLRRLFTRLPKAVIIDLVLIWLNHPLCPIPETTDDDDDYFMDDEEETIDQKAMIYEAYRDDINTPRKIVVDRILGNDWVSPPNCQTNS